MPPTQPIALGAGSAGGPGARLSWATMIAHARPSAPAQTALAAWYRENARDLPWRRSEFHTQFGAWGTLVAEFMLQQTPVSRVIPHLEAWLDRWPSPAAQAAATPAETVTQWANLGYPRRALWLRSAAIQICERHDGVVPREVPALLALSGIGDYTARAVAVFAYGEHHPVVDTNTRRVLARAIDGHSQPAPPAKRDLAAMDVFLDAAEEADRAVLNAATMELGAVICTARSPHCAGCPISETCAWRGAGYPDTGDARRRQARYEGSDRQARGAVLRMLRVTGAPLNASEVLRDWPDSAQRDRAIDSLIADGLVEAAGGLIALPGNLPTGLNKG